jgi:acyl carrier protein
VVGRSVDGDLRLAAYVVPSAMAAPAAAGELAAALAEALRRLLPEPMVPAAFVFLEALPRTPHGKLDRAALPSPESWSTGSRAPYVAPRTAVEEVIAGFWREVLGAEPVGVEDDFFALGGHSLLATQVLSRVFRAFGVQVPLRQLFGSPTVATLAAAVLDRETAPGRSEKIARAHLKIGRMSAESKRELLASRRGAAEAT